MTSKPEKGNEKMTATTDTPDKVETHKQTQQKNVERKQRSALSAVKRRMLTSSGKIGMTLPDEVVFQHSVFCQTVLPYRNPGNDIRVWKREQGQIRLHLEAGYVEDLQGCFIPAGLPYGPVARLILCYLNTEALKTGSPAIEVQGSLTAFVARLHGFSPDGRQIRKFKFLPVPIEHKLKWDTAMANCVWRVTIGPCFIPLWPLKQAYLGIAPLGR